MTQRVVYQFESYELRPGAGLFRGGESVRVPPQELGLLHLLVRMDGGVVSHKEIEKELWPRQLVSYASIARCVYSLRRIFKDAGPKFIETVPRRGYRLAVRVERIEDTAQPKTIDKTVETVPLAYSHYLEGLRESNRWQPEAQARAVALFEEAHRVDPSYAVALAAVADCRMYQSIRGYVYPADAERLGRLACEQALEIDPDLIAARAAIGWLVENKAGLGDISSLSASG